MTTIVDQPPPTPNARPSIQSLVRADLVEREQVGIGRYGMPLRAFNGRNGLVDLYQELLDACCYVRQVIAEGEEHPEVLRLRAENAALIAQLLAAEAEARRPDAETRRPGEQLATAEQRDDRFADVIARGGVETKTDFTPLPDNPNAPCAREGCGHPQSEHTDKTWRDDMADKRGRECQHQYADPSTWYCRCPAFLPAEVPA